MPHLFAPNNIVAIKKCFITNDSRRIICCYTDEEIRLKVLNVQKRDDLPERISSQTMQMNNNCWIEAGIDSK